MGLKISGLASGMPSNLVEQVIEAERMPIKQTEAKKAKIEDKVKLVGDFETKINDITKNMSSMMGRRGFVDKKFTSSFPEIINGTVDPENAEPGEWNLEVIQLASKPSVVSNGFPDKDSTSAGVGYIKFETSNGTKEVYISEEESTLEKIAEKINMSNLGTTATVVNDVNNKDRGYKIELSGSTTGEDNNIEFPLVYLLDGELDFQFDNKKEAKNARYKLDGHEFETAENTIKDLLPGVTVDLHQTKPGQEVKLKISENYDIISEKVKGFVDSYNAALAFIQSQNKLTPDKEGRPRLGPLGGESFTRMSENKLKGIIQSRQDTGSKFNRILDLGVEFNRNGTLNFNVDKFKKIVNTDPKDVIKFMRGNNVDVGFIPNLIRQVKQITDPNTGTIGARKTAYESRVRQMNDQIERKEKSLVRREEQLRKQFGKMEEAMSKIQNQGAAINGGKG
jgi:flagellar hook-associated protein 2